jgi:DNA adenine methylase
LCGTKGAKLELFYLDQPYWGNEDDYGRGLFSPDRFAELAEQQRRLKGSFILSLNDVPGVR